FRLGFRRRPERFVNFMALPRIYAAQKIDWSCDDVSARQLKRARCDQNPRTIKTVCETETPRQSNRLAPADQSRALTHLQRRDNHRSPAHAATHWTLSFTVRDTRRSQM